MLRVLLVAAVATAVTKSNWAPGYRTAGNATTINDGEAEETWAAYDHAYKAPNGWELQPFAYQNPDRYTGWYADKRSKCKWSSPVSVFAHTKKYLRSTYGGAFTGSKWKSRNMYNQWSQSSLEAQVCTQTWEQDGHKYQLDITRLGPIILNPGKIINTFFVPAAPLDDDMAYLVEAVDGYLDDNLLPLSYPPVHPHHSAVYVTGFPEKLAYNNPSSPFFGFNPIARLPLSSMNEQGKKSNGDDWLQTSTNTPGARAASFFETRRRRRGGSIDAVDATLPRSGSPSTPSSRRALSVQTDRFPTQASTTTCMAATPI